MSREAIESFVDEIRDEVPKLRRALAIIHACPEDRDALHEAHRLAHSIKGTALLVQIPVLSEIALKQELLIERIMEGRLSMDHRLRDTLERLTDIFETYASGLLVGSVPEQKLLDDANALFGRHASNESQGSRSSVVTSVGRNLMSVADAVTDTSDSPTVEDLIQSDASLIELVPSDPSLADERQLLVCDESIQGPTIDSTAANESLSHTGVTRIEKSADRSAETSAHTIETMTSDADDVVEDSAVQDQATLDDDALFHESSVEHLQEMAHKLDHFRRDLTRWDLLADVRRRIHSLKGAASTCGFLEFAHLAHHTEDLLQRMLDWTVPPTESSVDCLQACVDALEQQLDNNLDSSIQELLHERLDEICGGQPRPLSPEPHSVLQISDESDSAQSELESDYQFEDVAHEEAYEESESLTQISRSPEAVTIGHVDVTVSKSPSNSNSVEPTPVVPNVDSAVPPVTFTGTTLVHTDPRSIQLDDHDQRSGEMLEVFTEEAEDHLRQIYSAFAGLEKQPEKMSLIQDVRRSAHTIKGAAGSVGLRQVSKLSHRMEDLLDGLFESQQPLTPSTLALLYGTTDTLQDLVYGNYPPAEMQVTIAQLYDGYDIALTPQAAASFSGSHVVPVVNVADSVSEHVDEVGSLTLPKPVELVQAPAVVESVQGISDVSETIERHDHETPTNIDIAVNDEVFTALDQPINITEIGSVDPNSDEVDLAIEETEAAASVTSDATNDPIPEDAAATETVVGETNTDEVTAIEADEEPAGPPGDVTHNIEVTAEDRADETTLIGEEGLTNVAPQLAQEATFSTHSAIEPIDESLVRSVLPSLSVWNRLPSPPNEAAKQPNASDEKKPSETLRVPVERIDALVREVGELIINRSSFEQRMADFAHCVEEIRRAVERLRGTSNTLDTKYGVGALGGRRRLWGDGASLLRGGTRLPNSSSGVRRPGQQHEEFDALEMDRYSEFHLLSRSLAETTTDIGTVGQELQNLIGDFDQLLNRQGRLSRGTQDRLMRIRMVPLAVLATRLHRTVRVVAGQQGKQIDFLIQGGETEFDKMALEELADPLMHILRNSVDHGIESTELRLKVGKPQRATIALHAFYQGTQAVLRVTDDGSGLDLNAIRETAIRNGLVTADAATNFTEEELSAFIFLPGFSTARTLSEVSGRGVGMDIVRDKVLKLKGTVSVESRSGQGTTITIRLPMTLAMTRALLVHSSNETFALPMQSVTQILRIERDKIEYVDGEPIIRIKETTMPLVYLSDRLQLRLPQDKTSQALPVLIVASGDERAAIAVEKISHGRDIVVKTLGSHLRRVQGLIGATLLGDGSVIPILDAAGLVGHAGTVTRATPRSLELPTNLTTEIKGFTATTSAFTRREQPVIMVVDDSVSVRRVMLNLLKKVGWTVIDAKDGVDAIEKLHLTGERPDLFLLDIEMPRMDGYELLSSLRSTDEHRETPIIMVTSRAGDKHRNKAMHLGATDYVVKPYQDDQLLSLIRKLLVQEPVLA